VGFLSSRTSARAAMLCIAAATLLAVHATASVGEGGCVVEPTYADLSRCELDTPVPAEGMYACSSSCADNLEVSYHPLGSIGCGQGLTMDQAAVAPTVTFNGADADQLYTLFVIDSNSDFDILHFSGCNIAGGELMSGVQLDANRVDPFWYPYRGPNPPKYIPATYGYAFRYAFVLFPQAEWVDQTAVPDAGFPFDLDLYVETLALGPYLSNSTYFYSGHCAVDPEGCPDADQPLRQTLCLAGKALAQFFEL